MAPKNNAIDRSAEFAVLFEELISRVLSNAPVDWGELQRTYPEHAEELDNLVATARTMAGWGGIMAEKLTDDAAIGHDDILDDELRLLGDYRIIRELGRGGMGVVYEAEQMTLRRRVALKILPFASLLDKRRLERFRNEARAAATLSHQNIIGVHTVGHDKGVYYFAMDLVEGRNLAQVIEARTLDREASHAADDSNCVAALSTVSANRQQFYRAVAEVGVQVAEALDHAHQTGIVHRDIKPSNIMLDRFGQVKIADFGLARFCAEASLSLTETGDVLGTLRYMSPEQLQNGVTADQRSDVYSLGASLYELAIGTPMWHGDDRAALIKNIIEHSPARPTTRDRNMPKDLEIILMNATAREPGERYETAQDLADDLKRFLAGHPVWAKPASAFNRFWKLVKRNPLPSAGLAVFVVSLICALTLTSASLRRATRSEQRLAHDNYINDMALAWRLYHDNNLTSARRILNKY